ncbi:MAG TPA: PQQ-binding-like beta-propeller repeat protein [Ktedonobacteraceae bacterium]|nr:PQQ-binding-like beta-propeller repeat protein [Ktedonobacteraceae bacterium]
MRRLFQLLVLGIVLMLLAGCGAVSPRTITATNHNRVINASLLEGSGSGDWPMFGYDPGHTGFVDQLVQPRTIQGKLVWKRQLNPIFSSPVAGLNMLYIASTDGYLYALRQDSGAVVWRVRLDNLLTDATPALEGQVLFVAMHSKAIGAFDAHTGQMYWSFDVGEKIQAPPVVVGGRVFVASLTHLWVLNAASGRVAWTFKHGTSGWPTTGSPAILGNAVYIGLGTGSQLWALNLADGHVLWSFDTGDRITSSAVVQGSTVYIATWQGKIFALDRASGKLRWVYALNTVRDQNVVDGVGGSMALANNRLYVGDYRGSISCIDALHGTLIWRFATGAQVLATPVAASERIYVGSSDGFFYALDSKTGRPAWRYATGEIRGSASLAGGHLYVGSLNGMLYAFS